jgi:predicted dehydrogenase
MCSKKVKVALIGANGIARQHAEAINTSPHSVFYGVCDLNKEAVNNSAKKYGAKPFYDYRDVMADSEIDAVVIASPDETHAMISIAAAEAGKHVLVEKPPATCRKDISLMLEAAKRNDIKIMCGLSQRFFRRNSKILDAVAAGKIGRTIFARILLGCCGNSWTADSEYLARYKDKPYFVFEHNGIHVIDLACQVFNDFPETVFVQSQRINKDLPIDDYFAVTIGFKNGIAVTEDNRAAYFSKLPIKGTFQVMGSKGMLSFDGEDAGMRAWSEDGTMIPFSTMYAPNENGTIIQTKKFIEALAFNKELPINFKNTAKVFCVLEAAIQSYKSRRNERVNYET